MVDFSNKSDFIRYISRSYGRIIDVIDSCETEEHVETTITMCNNFLTNCYEALTVNSKIFSKKERNELGTLIDASVKTLDALLHNVKKERETTIQKKSSLGFSR